MFTKQFKVLIGVIIIGAVAALAIYTNLLTQKQLDVLKERVDSLEVTRVMATPTPLPTATPSASLKKAVYPSWTPTPVLKK